MGVLFDWGRPGGFAIKHKLEKAGVVGVGGLRLVWCRWLKVG